MTISAIFQFCYSLTTVYRYLANISVYPADIFQYSAEICQIFNGAEHGDTSFFHIIIKTKSMNGTGQNGTDQVIIILIQPKVAKK